MSKGKEKNAEKSAEDDQVYSAESMMAFFLMPGDAISLLHFQLYSVVGENLAETILYKYGMRCGRSTTENLSLGVKPMSDIPPLLQQIWMELGFGRMTTEPLSERSVKVVIKDGIEANSLGYRTRPSCHFTRGYIAGMVAALGGSNVVAEERACACVGDEACEFVVEETVL